MGLDLNHLIPSKIKTLDYFTLDDLKNIDGYVKRHSPMIMDNEYSDIENEKIIFFESKGYQRKGMSSKFFLDFTNDTLYFHLDNVMEAYSYLEDDHINTLSALQQNFQINFIDNFVEGESVFYVSW